MRHRKAGRKLGMDSSARKAMFRNMVTSLMVHGRIKTTKQRAKELRRVAERVISVGKRAPSLTDLEGLEGEALQQAKADRVAAIRRLGAVTRHDRHGDLRQVVVNDVVEPAFRQQLRRGRGRLAPETAGAADSDVPVFHECSNADRFLTYENKSV